MIDKPPAQTCHGSSKTPTMPMTNNAQWKVQYARFFTFPSFSLSSTTPTSDEASTKPSSLRPIYPHRKRRVKGTWVPSFSSNAAIRILSHHPSFSEPTLVVSFQEKIYIQKFAVRFSSSTESQAFMESLKCLKEAGKVDCSGGPMPIVFHQRVDEESIYATPTTPLWQPTMKQEQVPHSCSQRAVLSHASEGTDAALPPSFTALMSESCSEIHPGLSAAPLEHDLNHFFKVGSMADNSFMEMLDKIESVITGLGGDLSFGGPSACVSF